ncbi:hypothetical protein G6F57_008592 [Rhizopus arrhizus]|uniref:Uncharacterized protein n=1 Tax=Rhizopus oryzae TaxID=64495 RepID=A0A9P7BQB4_RHIOR|nr:hypothetical protein G6F23_003730 [Rhizopus arrhizus]KAG1417015.1 hypothetical protein G6F58_005691 [Rhizopus delemar]KAG0947137.1 hypothetical protein G6F30_003428 [Rhizopus arrhizus]KAG0977734.1 hypothetical protein G6F29_009840 [Rhizopus arrhizus]KAG0990384.1 hypothetical protein G6F28_009332 [Rhizopus arrhizus]
MANNMDFEYLSLIELDYAEEIAISLMSMMRVKNELSLGILEISKALLQESSKFEASREEENADNLRMRAKLKKIGRSLLLDAVKFPVPRRDRQRMVWLGYGSLEAFWNPLRCQEGKPKTVVLAERGLVHSRALELEGYVAFLRSLFEHIAVLQTHYVIHQLVKLLPIRFTDSFGYYLISGTSLLAIP